MAQGLCVLLYNRIQTLMVVILSPRVYTATSATCVSTLYSAWSCKNKAIRDGKYLARHMPVLGNVHPIDVISLLARVFILLIDTATQEVPMKNI